MSAKPAMPRFGKKSPTLLQIMSSKHAMPRVGKSADTFENYVRENPCCAPRWGYVCDHESKNEKIKVGTNTSAKPFDNPIIIETIY